MNENIGDSAAFKQTPINPYPAETKSIEVVYTILRWRDPAVSEPFERREVGLPAFRQELPVFTQTTCQITRRVIPNGAISFPIALRSSGIIELEPVSSEVSTIDIDRYKENQGHYLECAFPIEPN